MITASALIGTWKFSRPETPSKVAFLHFTETRAFDYLEDQTGRQVMRLWYSLEEPSLIRFCNDPKDESWTCGIEFDGETLTITAQDTRTICVRARAEEIPEWFQQTTID